MTNFRLPHRTDSQRWPQTCNFCGAPLFSGRCPRCGYERQKEGESIFSGFSEGGGGAVGTIISPAGAGTSPGSTVTIPNITIPANAVLVVFAGITGDGPITASTVTWNGISLASTINHSSFDGNLYANCFFRPPGPGGTGDIVATNTDPSLDVNFALADILSGPISYRQSWFAQSPVPQSSGSISIGVDPTDSEYHMIWVKGAATDPGAWDDGVISGSTLAIGGSFANGWLSSAFAIYQSHTTVVAIKSIAPAAAWYIHTTEFRSP